MDVNKSSNSLNTVNFIMSEGVVIEELVVTSTREAQFDDSKTGSALNITKEKIMYITIKLLARSMGRQNSWKEA